jgi:uncharacterized protein YbbC (DUF1343 family)
MTVDTIFDLASLSKAVSTATALSLLAERGAVDFGAPASRYLAELGGNGKSRITVEQLLLHTSGLPSVNPRTDYDAGREAALDRLYALPLVATPGARYEYSDLGFIVLGELVARVAGEPLDRFASREIFEPLGMRDTTYAPSAALVPRIAPTEITDHRGTPRELIRGAVHDPRAHRLGGVAGNAGVFSTADDLARFARAMLGEGMIDGERVLSPAVVRRMTETRSVAGGTRTLGWDAPTTNRRARGFSARAYGHFGFTGTALWIDPELDLFVLFLSNRVHPDGTGDVAALIPAIEEVAVGARARVAPPPPDDAPAVLTGIDVLRRDGFAALRGARVGVLTNASGRARDGTRTIDLLVAAPEVDVRVAFSPEHGLDANREGHVRRGRDARTGLVVQSLFGATRRPTPAMLEGLDAIVVDLQDAGVRFYTYGATLLEVMRAAAEANVRVVVLDRPNPLDGVTVEGPVLDPALGSFVNYHPLPVRHGLTLGELARLLAADLDLDVRLDVVGVEGWDRRMRYEETGLPWAPPSPNLRAARTALAYPATALLEGTNVSVGRGTDTPFEILGAPFIDAAELAAFLARETLPGVRFTATHFVPRAGPHRGLRCHGVALEITDPSAFRPVRTGLALARGLFGLHPREWDATRLAQMVGRTDVVEALRAGEPLDAIEARYEDELARFREQRARMLE